jgi:hypothetical protein
MAPPQIEPAREGLHPVLAPLFIHPHLRLLWCAEQSPLAHKFRYVHAIRLARCMGDREISDAWVVISDEAIHVFGPHGKELPGEPDL